MIQLEHVNYYELAISQVKSAAFLADVKSMLKKLKIEKAVHPLMTIGFQYYYDTDSNKIVINYFEDHKWYYHSVLEKDEKYNTHKLFFAVIYGYYSQSKLTKMIAAINSNEANNSFDFDEDALADALIKKVKRNIIAIEKISVQHETSDIQKREMIRLALAGTIPFSDINQQIPVFKPEDISVLEDVDYDFSFLSLQEGASHDGRPLFLWNTENLKIVLSHRQLLRSIITSSFFQLKGIAAEVLATLPGWIIDLFSFIKKECDPRTQWKLARLMLALIEENNRYFETYDDYRAEFLDQYLEKEYLSENEKNYKLFFSMFDELNNSTMTV